MADRYDRDYHEPRIMKRHDEDFASFVVSHFTQAIAFWTSDVGRDRTGGTGSSS